MKNFILGHRFGSIFGLMLTSCFIVPPANGVENCPAILDHSFLQLNNHEPQSLCDYKGKVILVVNSASYCGFTRQYDGLEALYAKYKARGLVVLGFPSNDFGAQEPGGDKEIAKFCRLTYGVKFPMYSKSHVVGPDANPLFKQLAVITGQAPQWNFHKYLIDKKGNVSSFNSETEPNDPRLIAAIEKAL
jgi:glutathione peroxidase